MKVIVSDPISEDGIRILKDNNIKVIYAVDENIDDNFKHIQSADGWIIRSGTTLDSKIINNAVNLSVIGRAGVGVDNIDIEIVSLLLRFLFIHFRINNYLNIFAASNL